MEWHYVQDGKAVGPVSDPQLEELFRSGKVTESTLVWHAGLNEWQPLGGLRSQGRPQAPSGASAVANQSSQGSCAECGRRFPAEEMLVVNNALICTECKPVFLQKLKEGVQLGQSKVWRDGRVLVMGREATLPDRCVKCNAPANGQKLARNLYWHPSGYYLLVLVNLLIYLLVALLVRKRAKISVGLCEKHRSRRRIAIATAWILTLASLALVGWGINSRTLWLIPVGILLFLAGAIYGLIQGRVVTPNRIDQEHVWLRGVCAEYLETLPEWNRYG